MDCEFCVIGNIQEIKELDDSILIKIKFKNSEIPYVLPKNKCDLIQISKLMIGTKLSCVFKGDRIVKLFLEPAIYTEQAKD